MIDAESAATRSAKSTIARWRSVRSALAGIDRHLVGDQRILGPDAQDRTVGDDAVEAVVDAPTWRRRSARARPSTDPSSESISAAWKSKKARNSAGRRARARNTLGTKPDLLLHGEDLLADVVGQVVEVGHVEPRDPLVAHRASFARRRYGRADHGERHRRRGGDVERVDVGIDREPDPPSRGVERLARQPRSLGAEHDRQPFRSG